MQVSLIPSIDINSDLGIVNTARVSLNKQSSFIHIEPSTCIPTCNPETNLTHWTLNANDIKLINYLARYNHWTPFAHSRLYFEIAWKSQYDELVFYRNYNPGGFSIVNTDSNSLIKGSLYSWIRALNALPWRLADYIGYQIRLQYPIASRVLSDIGIDNFGYLHGGLEVPEQLVFTRQLWKLATVTLRIKVPIFIARQIRTSQVGIAYSDLYVESESFVYNEVSRRYVNDKPEFYTIDQWRTRKGSNVKQGSTGLLDNPTIAQIGKEWIQELEEKRDEFYAYANTCSIAPEQSRAYLTQNMYTEFYMTGTLHRFAQFLKLRLDSHVQQETQDIATLIKGVLISNYPEWAQEYKL